MLSAIAIQDYPDVSLQADAELHLTTWNLGKRKRGPVLPQLGRLCTAEHSTLIALQECSAKLPIPDNYGAHFGLGFRVPPFGAGHGVMTLSSAQPQSAQLLRSPHRELRVATSKVAMATTYAVSDGRELLVLNVHALNFDRTGKRFLAQIDELGSLLADHGGPVVFCGDFNTWHPGRLGELRRVADDCELSEVPPEIGGRTGSATPLGNWLLGLDTNLVLDRMFYRHLELREHRWLTNFDASDHTPLHARFAFEA